MQGKICQTFFAPAFPLIFSLAYEHLGAGETEKQIPLVPIWLNFLEPPLFFLLLRISFLHPAVFPDEALSLEKMLLSETEDLGMSYRQSQLGC